MTLADARARIGHEVEYSPFPGAGRYQVEEGVITSVTEMYVFVRFYGQRASKACVAASLALTGRRGRSDV